MRRKKIKRKPTDPQITHLTATPSGQVAQMLASATSKQELNSQAQAALLRVRNRLECPEDNLRELTCEIVKGCC